MAVSDAKKKANKKSDAEYYAYKSIKYRREWEFAETVKDAADLCGESLNGFMIRAIRDRVESLGVSFPVPVLPEKPTDEE